MSPSRHLTRRQLGGVAGITGIAAAGLYLGGFPRSLGAADGAVVASSARLPAA